jgi:hypothetical protein
MGGPEPLRRSSIAIPFCRGGDKPLSVVSPTDSEDGPEFQVPEASMNYISRKIDAKIAFLTNGGDAAQSEVYLRSKIEYALLTHLGYLWNRNFQKLDPNSKASVLNKVLRPTIGTVVGLCSQLNSVDPCLSKGLQKSFDGYPHFRNDRLGHGYVFGDAVDQTLNEMRLLADSIFETSDLLRKGFDLVLVQKLSGTTYRGLNLAQDGRYYHWTCSREVQEFDSGSTYLQIDKDKPSYSRVSPFLHICDEDEFYIFRDIEENLTGRVRYNRLLKTATFCKEWPELVDLDVSNDGVRRVAANGIIINMFENNFSRYIAMPDVKSRITRFLTSKASVCATVWGHGGVGKTASVQSTCQELVALGAKKKFDYIVYVSAKDRTYNYFRGMIEGVQPDRQVNTLQGVVSQVNATIRAEPSDDATPILEMDGKILIIIDDFETFHEVEKQKVEHFIKELNVNHHKVIITTRANIIVGEEIRTNELAEAETLEFFRDAYQILNESPAPKGGSEFPAYLQRVTNGRPLFIFQFAQLAGQKGELMRVGDKISTSKEAIEFLYGRIYEYLSDTAKNIFVSMGQLVAPQDMTNLTEKVRFLLDMEQDEHFDEGLQELVKLRVIELFDQRFFRVYSSEIREIMENYFHQRDDAFKSRVKHRLLRIGKDKGRDVEWSLLDHANAARFSKTEEEVLSNYRNIIRHKRYALKIREAALLNLADYFYNNRGKKENAVRILEEYQIDFKNSPDYIKALATYCWSLNSESQRSRAVNILLEYFASGSKSLDPPSRNHRLELLGLLLTYRGVFHIGEREELKARQGQIPPDEYRNVHNDQKQLFVEICTQQGAQVYKMIQVNDFADFSPGAKQNALTGLLQYVELLSRISRNDTAIAVCEYVLDRIAHPYTDEFRRKLLKIQSFGGRGRKTALY